MTIGNINDTAEVEKLNPLFASAFQWIRANWRTIHSTGEKQVRIDGDRVFANIDVADMRSRERQVLEVHRRYIDIHVPVDKDEVIGWRPVEGLSQVLDGYDEALDRAFYTDKPEGYFTLHPGEFAIMTPRDAHAPIIGDGKIHKICLKVIAE